MSEKLKPCPFCGGKAKLIKQNEDKRRQTNKIICTKPPCVYIERAGMFGVDDIIYLWNRRIHD